MTEKLPKLKNTSWVILLVLAVFLVSSVFIFIKDFPGLRRSFIFRSSEGEGLRIENRFEPVFPQQGRVQNYIDELLLGPVSEHCMPVFAKGTKVIYCLQNGSKLTVNLSRDFLGADAVNTDFRAQIELFKLNVKKNFPGIKEVELFVDGRIPFEKIPEKN